MGGSWGIVIGATGSWWHVGDSRKFLGVQAGVFALLSFFFTKIQLIFRKLFT